MKFTRELLGRKNQKGVALLIAIFTVVVITYLVSEILYDTNVEYVVNTGAVNRIKAYYAAKSGLEISLLRIKLFKKIQKQFGSQIPADKKKMLDMIWEMPFAWPPLIPAEASGVDKDMINEKIKEATMDASYVATIFDEGSKIDLNDLASPSKSLQAVTKRLLMQIFENRLKNDEDWARKHPDFKYEEVINNIIDWEDADQTSLNGGDERAQYGNLPDVGKPMPPNRGFRSVEELRMVAGMTDEIFDMLKDRVTVYGMKAINPNHATLEVLKALDPSITDEVGQKIISRRDDPNRGPFLNENDFWGFVNSEGGNVSAENQKIPLVFDEVTNFRIRSSGEYANATREIEAIVYDFSAVGSKVANQLQTDAGGGKGTSSSQGKSSNNSNDPLPKGPPRIVYLIER